MTTILRHLLLLVVGVLLLPPQGWCCLVPSPAPPKGEAPAPVQACCGACCSTAPVEKDEPTAPPRAWCCCDSDDRAKTERVDLPILDACVAWLPIVAVFDVPAGQTPAPVESPPPPLRPLHLLRCVWLC